VTKAKPNFAGLRNTPPRETCTFIDWSQVVAIVKGDYDETAREGLGDWYAVLVFGGGARLRINITVTKALNKLRSVRDRYAAVWTVDSSHEKEQR
jgi:hypothetical protein